MTGVLEHIDGRKLIVAGQPYYLRKGVDASQFFQLLESEVEVLAEEEKGFLMVKEIKPALPKTAIEETKGPVDMPPSANVPKLQFGQDFSAVAAPADKPKEPRDQKSMDIMRQWAMGAVLNSHALANCNDSMALSTQQTLERAKRLAEELTRWVVTR